jgi:hypothetical protein
VTLETLLIVVTHQQTLCLRFPKPFENHSQVSARSRLLRSSCKTTVRSICAYSRGHIPTDSDPVTSPMFDLSKQMDHKPAFVAILLFLSFLQYLGFGRVAFEIAQGQIKCFRPSCKKRFHPISLPFFWRGYTLDLCIGRCFTSNPGVTAIWRDAI